MKDDFRRISKYKRICKILTKIKTKENRASIKAARTILHGLMSDDSKNTNRPEVQNTEDLMEILNRQAQSDLRS